MADLLHGLIIIIGIILLITVALISVGIFIFVSALIAKVSL